MEQGTQVAPVSNKKLWAGRVVSALPVLMLLFSASMKLMGGPEMAKNWEHFGYPDSIGFRIGIVEVLCALIYAIPRTSVLGAILVTGYLGGATATHVRIGEMVFIMPVILGMLAWLGLWLREPRLHALLPLRK
jgi:hypothetical protein